MGPSGIVTNAALCTLTVPTSLLEGDVVLQLVLHLVSDRQVTVTRSTKKGAALELEHVSGGVVLTQRAAILRALAGPFLHYALDPVLLGGYGAASQNGGSCKAVLAISSLASWMTVAHNCRLRATANDAKTTDQLDEATVHLVEQLETYLETKSFLLPSSQATLADMDLCVALVKAHSVGQVAGFPPNVTRWITTVYAQMADLLGPSSSLPPLTTITPPPVPLARFFYGTEPFSIAAHPNATPAKTTNTTKTTTTTTTSQTTSTATAAVDPSSGLTDEPKKAAADKRAQKAAQKAKKQPVAAAGPPPASGDAAASDISALDIRVGKILTAWHHPDAEKLFCEEIDLGEGQPRQIASGLRPFYQIDDLVGRTVLVLCNLKSRSLVGFPSHGMVLCASNADHTRVEFVVPPPETPIGERVIFSNLTMAEPEPENKVAKKKIAEKLLPDLKTNDDGVVVWKGDHIAQTTMGPIKAVNGMANAHVG